jgi:NAD(P)-dependent dehydrogenase (short-subunit alcohol dehydrogenase family)
VAQTVLTTGANSGIGLATVLELARRGYDSVGSVRSPAKAEQVRRAARKAGVKVETVLMDVTSAADCRRVIERLKPYAVVNNAGYPASGAVEDVPDKEARAVLETMVIAPMRLARLALPHMREAGEGRIVNISSIYGVTTTPLSGWYQAAKHALEGISDALRMEIASDGVKVVLIEPGGFKTGIWEENKKALEQRKGSRYEAAYRRTMAGTRLSQPIMGEPETVARVIARAVSSKNPRARYLVGYDAQMLAMMEKLTPTIVKDRLSRLTLGL